MQEKISEIVINRLLIKGIVKEDEKEIYLFGLSQAILLFVDITFILLFGFIFHEIGACIIGTFSFMILRSYTGGYHANTKIGCLLITVLAVITMLSVAKFVVLTKLMYVIMLVTSGTIILILSPIEEKRKSLDQVECEIYKKKGRIVWLIEGSIALAGEYLDMAILYGAIVLSHVISSFAIIAGKIKQQERNII